MTKEEKRQLKFNLSGIGVIAVLSGLSLYMFVGVMIPMSIEDKKARAKQAVIDNRVKQYEKTLQYYKEYLQTKEQIAQYRDSLQRVMK